MLALTKVLHLLALGLWFGSSFFFSLIAALTIFHTFEKLGETPPDQRPTYLALPEYFDKTHGTRLAGAAVGPLFPPFFLLQGICAFVAVVTALSWSWQESANRWHQVRSLVLVLALVTVIAGWPLVEKVSQLRVARYAELAGGPAQAAFATWHTVSLLLNLGTLLLVTVAMVLAAWLPAAQAVRESSGSSA